MTMRNLIFAALIPLAGANAFAQGKLYLKPSAGIGFSKTKESQFGLFHGTKEIKTTSYNAGLGIGYRKKNISIESGIGYLKTGKQIPNMMYGDPWHGTMQNADLHIHYHHVVVPLRLSYHVKLTQRFSLSPAAGASLSYNAGVSNRYINSNGSKEVIYFAQKDFKQIAKPIGVLADGQLNGTYKLNKNIDIFGGPAFQYMITNIAKTQANATSEYKTHPYTWGINAGINLYWPEQTKPADTQKK